MRVILHSGSTPGFGSSIWMMPEQKIAIVILGNLTAAQFSKSLEKATELLMRLEPPAGKEQPHQVPMTEAEMEMIAGSYANPYLGAIHLCVRDHRLFFERVGFDLRFSVGLESPVAKLSSNYFEVGLPSGAPLHFWFIESGKSEPMLLNMGVRIFQKSTAPCPIILTCGITGWAELASRPQWTFSPYGDAVRTGDEPLMVSEFGNWGLPRLPDQLPWWFDISFGDRGVTKPAGVLEVSGLRFRPHIW